MATFGAYGKMPGLGDFFQLGLAPSFIKPWDAWLQTIMAQGSAALGARWQDCYMSAPIWRFCLSAGCIGTPVSGVLMPSVDKVGRMFPLTLATVGNPLQARALGALEHVALETLEGQMDRSALAQALGVVPPAQMETPAAPGSAWEAMLEAGPLRLTCKGLPQDADARVLFDLSAWPTPKDALERTIP